MKALILMGSPRKEGNTAALLAPLCGELEAAGMETETVWLYDRDIRPCTACRRCQADWSAFGCPQADDAGEIFEKILESGLVVLATPIYSWYCTPPMKALLDRLVYGMNKFYGEEKGPALWAGKPVALLTTCGYRPERGADLFEEACGAIAGIPGSVIWAAARSGTWAMAPPLWTGKRRPGRGPSPGSWRRRYEKNGGDRLSPPFYAHFKTPQPLSRAAAMASSSRLWVRR